MPQNQPKTPESPNQNFEVAKIVKGLIGVGIVSTAAVILHNAVQAPIEAPDTLPVEVLGSPIPE